MAFKANSDDVRDNLTAPLINLLEREGAATAVFDPLVAGYDEPGVLIGSDAIVLMTAHSCLRNLTEADVSALCDRRREDFFVFDMWNVWPWADRILGKGIEEEYADSRDRRLRIPHAPGHSISA
jgi:UDP-N-acetyl-D-mannosaminuronate dehydrogenase